MQGIGRAGNRPYSVTPTEGNKPTDKKEEVKEKNVIVSNQMVKHLF